jgi:hypothetical protein
MPEKLSYEVYETARSSLHTVTATINYLLIGNISLLQIISYY